MFRFTVLIIGVGLLLGIVFFFNTRFNLLLELADIKDSAGYLYKVIDSTGEKYMMVSDRKIVADDFEDENLVVEYLDASYIWNPKICAKMPTVIDNSGNIFMLDTQYIDGDFQKHFIIFDNKTKSKKYFNLTGLEVTSDLFLENDQPYFLTKNYFGTFRNVLVSYNLESFLSYAKLYKTKLNNDLTQVKSDGMLEVSMPSKYPKEFILKDKEITVYTINSF